MVQLNNKAALVSRLFIVVALVFLALGLFWGIAGALQYILPGFLRDQFSFQKLRPLHVSSVVFWIIMAAVGSMLTYLQQHIQGTRYSLTLIKVQLGIFIFSFSGILFAYLFGQFGGREYWEHPPIFALPILIGWGLFMINFFKAVGSLKNQPVYIWMWMTGLAFFLFTYLESYLWLLPYFSNHIVNDMTVQWKAYGSMVGSWNMLIYGSSIFLMDKITGNKALSYSKISFLLYFTGLFNLMFNWGHHIYTLPTAPYIKHISYAVSMTELFIIGRIIFKWKTTVTAAKQHLHQLAFRFLFAADIWIFLTLFLAILMSIPGINLYTHGTHITVAHTMGATIGINSFLLLAIATDIFSSGTKLSKKYTVLMSRGLWLANIALLIFWISLIGAGIKKAIWQMSDAQTSFAMMMKDLWPYFLVFFISGVMLSIGLLMIVFVLFKIRSVKQA